MTRRSGSDPPRPWEPPGACADAGTLLRFARSGTSRAASVRPTP